MRSAQSAGRGGETSDGGRGPCSPIGMLVTLGAWKRSFDRTNSGGRPTRCGVEGAKGRGGSRRPGPGPGRGAVRRLRCHSNPQSSSPPAAVQRWIPSTRRRRRRHRPSDRATGTRRLLRAPRSSRRWQRGHGRGGPPPAVGFSGTGHARRGASAQRPAQPRPGSNRLDCSRRIAHGCGRAQRPVVWQGHGRRAPFGQRGQGDTFRWSDRRHSTGTPASPVAAGGSPGVGGGTTGSAPPSGGTNPVAPAASAVGSTVSAVGSSARRPRTNWVVPYRRPHRPSVSRTRSSTHLIKRSARRPNNNGELRLVASGLRRSAQRPRVSEVAHDNRWIACQSAARTTPRQLPETARD